MEVGAVVRYVGDEKGTRLTRGMTGTIVREGRRGFDVRWDSARKHVSTGVAAGSLALVVGVTDEQRVAMFSAEHGVDPADLTAVGSTAVQHDNAAVLRFVLAADPERRMQLAGEVCEAGALRCLAMMWPSIDVMVWVVFTSAAHDSRCYDWVAAHHNDTAAFLSTIQRYANRAVNIPSTRSTSVRAVRRLVGSVNTLPLNLVNVVLRVFNRVAEADVRNAVVDVLTRRAAPEGEGFECPICAEPNSAPVQVFTQCAGEARSGGRVCFKCFQRSTVLRQTLWGSDHVFQANTSGTSTFMLNRMPISYVLFQNRLFTYAEFVTEFNMAGIGTNLNTRMRLGAVHSLI